MGWGSGSHCRFTARSLGLFFVEFACSTCVCVYFGFLLQSKDMHFKVIGLNGDKLNVCWSKCQPCNEPVTCPGCTPLSLGKRPMVADRVTSWEICSTLVSAFEWKGSRTACHVHMAHNVRGCWRSQITSEVQFGVYRKTQCSSNTNWTAAECGRLELTMQYLGD